MSSVRAAGPPRLHCLPEEEEPRVGSTGSCRDGAAGPGAGLGSEGCALVPVGVWLP